MSSSHGTRDLRSPRVDASGAHLRLCSGGPVPAPAGLNKKAGVGGWGRKLYLNNRKEGKKALSSLPSHPGPLMPPLPPTHPPGWSKPLCGGWEGVSLGIAGTGQEEKQGKTVLALDHGDPYQAGKLGCRDVTPRAGSAHPLSMPSGWGEKGLLENPAAAQLQGVPQPLGSHFCQSWWVRQAGLPP